MKSFEYKITDDLISHLRPSGLLCRTASEFKSKITLSLNGKDAEAGKLFSLLDLGMRSGDTVKVTVHGEDEDNAYAIIQNFFKENL